MAAEAQPRIRAWLVEHGDGTDALFLDRPAAERYAARHHGLLVPLVPLARRRDDDRLPAEGETPP